MRLFAPGGIALTDAHVLTSCGPRRIMQVVPATGTELNVGDIRIAEPNVHAGTKYMDQLMTRHFGDAQCDDTNRTSPTS